MINKWKHNIYLQEQASRNEYQYNQEIYSVKKLAMEVKLCKPGN